MDKIILIIFSLYYMTSRELKRLNNYPEFRTDGDIDDIIDFVANNVLPAGLNARRTARYNRKFGAGSGFVVRNNNTRLFYKPNPDIDIEVIKPTNRQARIQAVFNDVRRGLGTGLGAFYHQIAMSYLNIPKTLTDEFLRQQGDYLVARVPRKLVNKPILTRVPNERWGVDLINMETYTSIQNHFRRYILTVVDYFSGKVFARALRNRNNNAVNPTLSNAINDICVNEAQTFPHTIQGDGEFTAGAFRAWCNANNIEFIKTTSYTPTSNGKVERMNREIRKKIKAGFIRQNNLVWNAVGQLQSYVENINNQQSSVTHFTPNQLWTQGYNPHPQGHPIPPRTPLNDNMNMNERQQHQDRNINDRATQLVSKGRPPPLFQVGDLVRVKVSLYSNRMRRARENNIGWNQMAVHYTPQILTVAQAFHYPPPFVRRDEYILQGLGGAIVMRGGAPRRFFGNELIAVPAVNVQTNVQPMTIHRADQINRLR